MKKIKEFIADVGWPRVIIALFLLSLFCLAPIAQVSILRSISDIFQRFGQVAILVLAMIPMVQSGCGLNFGLPLGIISGLLGSTIAMQLEFKGMVGFLAAAVMSVIFALVFGYGYGILLNKVKGDEMTIALYVGFSSVAFMCIMWLLLPFHNPVMIWGYGGSGLRTTITTEGYWLHVLDDKLAIKYGEVYSLSEQTLAKLKQDNFPADLTAKLEELSQIKEEPKEPAATPAEGVAVPDAGAEIQLSKDYTYREFRAMLEKGLTTEQLAQYEPVILQRAQSGEIFKFPTMTILAIAGFCGLIWAFFHTKTGTALTAVGSNPEFARAGGIQIDQMRIVSVVMSTVLGAIGILFYQQSFGFIQLYLGPLYMAFPAVAAILIGGASLHKATIVNVVIGTFLFQGILTMTPSVINSLIQTDMSEVIRIITSNGMILYALTRITKTKGNK